MEQEKRKCMVCANLVDVLKGGICEPCQDRIRREALGEQAGAAERADREIAKHGVSPGRK